MVFTLLPEDKNLPPSKFKAFADDKVNVTKNINFVFHRIGNIVGKGENAGYQHFLFSQQCFQKAFCPRGIKSLEYMVKNKSLNPNANIPWFK